MLGHPLTVQVLTAGTAVALVVTPLFVSVGLRRFFMHRDWFRPERSHAIPAALTWKRHHYEQLHLAACRKASASVGLTLHLSSSVLLAGVLVRDLAAVARARRGPVDHQLLVCFANSVLVLLASTVNVGVSIPLLLWQGPKMFLLGNMFAATLYTVPTMHTLLKRAVHNFVTRGEDKMLDVEES